jgi:hypothetical protein
VTYIITTRAFYKQNVVIKHEYVVIKHEQNRYRGHGFSNCLLSIELIV